MINIVKRNSKNLEKSGGKKSKYVSKLEGNQGCKKEDIFTYKNAMKLV